MPGPRESGERRSGVEGERRADSVRRLLELFAVTGLAITQPLLDVAGRAPEFFIYHRAGRWEIVAFALLATLAPAALLWAVEELVGLVREGARRTAHLLILALLLTALAIQVIKELADARGAGVLVLALAAGVAVAVALQRSEVGRRYLRYLSPAPILFALLFFVSSPVGELVTSSAEASGNSQTAARRPPIVMVIFDELGLASLTDARGRIDRRLFPNFARLAEDSTWFRNASGVSGSTPIAIPAILTGRYPRKPLAPSYLTYPDNLFTLLAGSYDVHASESVAELCPPDVCRSARVTDRPTGLAPVTKEMAIAGARIVSPFGSDVDPSQQFVDRISREERPRAGGEQDGGGRGALPRRPGKALRFRFAETVRASQPTRVAEFVESLRASPRPTLHFLHVLLPHVPWRYLPSGRTYPHRRKFGVVGPGRLDATADRWPALVNMQRHLLQLVYTDRVVGEIVGRLKAQGMYDDALVVMAADHGIRFNRRDRRESSAGRELDSVNAWSLGPVPTFVKEPRQRESRVDERNFVGVDLLPTIADVLGARVPWRLEGHSGLGPDRRTTPVKPWYDKPGERKTFHGPAARRAALRGLAVRFARPKHGPRGLFEFGPHRDLVGRSVDELGVAAPVRAARVSGNVGQTVRLDPGAGDIPAEVWGTAEGLPNGAAVAVALNGVVGGVSLVFRRPGRGQEIAAMVDDRLFRAGGNAVRLYLVEPAGANPRLRPIALLGPS